MLLLAKLSIHELRPGKLLRMQIPFSVQAKVSWFCFMMGEEFQGRTPKFVDLTYLNLFRCRQTLRNMLNRRYRKVRNKKQLCRFLFVR